jgi:hypothetical protein
LTRSLAASQSVWSDRHQCFWVLAVQHFARWIVLAVFSATSLLGQGLHLLTGCGDLAGHLLANRSCSTHVDCRGCCQRKPHDASAGNSDDSGGAAWVGASQGHSDDCLICRFLAQGKLTSYSHAFLESAPLRPQLQPAAPSILMADAIRPYSARAPPVSTDS